MAQDSLKLDAMVGERIRRRRLRLGMTQKELASALDVSRQQLQKYEHGENRIGAGLLRKVAVKLRVSVAYFYDEAPAAPPVDGPQDPPLNALERELLTGFRAITSETIRQSIVRMVSAISSAAPV